MYSLMHSSVLICLNHLNCLNQKIKMSIYKKLLFKQKFIIIYLNILDIDINKLLLKIILD